MQGHLVQVGHLVLEVLQAPAAQVEVQVLQVLEVLLEQAVLLELKAKSEV